MAEKPKLDIGMVFGPAKAGPGTGPDEDFKDLAHSVLDGSTPMAARIDALHELIKMCMDEKEGGSVDGDAASEEQGGESSGGY